MDPYYSTHLPSFLTHTGNAEHYSPILRPGDSSELPDHPNSPSHPVILSLSRLHCLSAKLLFFPGYFFLSFFVTNGYPVLFLPFRPPDDRLDVSTDLLYELPEFHTDLHPGKFQKNERNPDPPEMQPYFSCVLLPPANCLSLLHTM